MRRPDVVEVPMHRLREWSAGSPVIRAEAPADGDLPALGLRTGDGWAAAFVRPTHTHGVNLMIHAEDASGGAASVEELTRSTPFDRWLGLARAKGATGLSLPRAAEGLGLLADVGGRWEFMWTDVAPPRPPRSAEVVVLRPEERAELVDFLEVHNPRTDGQPFAREGQRWVGVRGGDGTLLACGCCEVEHAGAPVLAGITVAPSARGRGLGGAVTAELTAGAVARHGWSTLGMYSDNDIARRVYLGLGYVLGARWTSGRLA